MPGSSFWRFTVKESHAATLRSAVSDIWSSAEDFWKTCRPFYWADTLERAVTFAVGSDAFRALIENRLYQHGLRPDRDYSVEVYA